MRKRYVLLGMTSLLAVAIAVPAFGGPSNPVANTLSSAKSTAKKALKKAKAANTAAKAAQATADGAQSTADNAKSSADGAQTSADAAQADATQALTNAAAAQATADSKFGNTDPVFGTTSNLDSSSSKIVFATCPTGESVVGGGFATSGVGANDVTPTTNSVYLNSWVAIANEIGAGTLSTWNIQANAVCLLP